MKKTWVIVLALVAVAAVVGGVIFFGGGGFGNTGLKGDWIMKDYSGVSREGTLTHVWKYNYREFGALHLSFDGAGKGSWYVTGSRKYETPFFYSIEGNTLVYKERENSLGHNVPFSFENGNLVFKQEEFTVVFARDK